MLFNLDIAHNAILSCFFYFFLIINLYYLIPKVIAQFFNPIAELVINIGIRSKESETEIHSVTAEVKV